MTQGIVTAIVLLTLAIIAGSLKSNAKGSIEIFNKVSDINESFKISKWLILFYIISILCAVGLVGWLYINYSGSTPLLIFLTCCFILLCMSGIIVDSKKKLIIKNETIKFIAYYGKFEISYNDLIDVNIGSGYIALDIGQQYKKLIPLTMEKSGRIFSILKVIGQK
jgi:hypothetical protein